MTIHDDRLVEVEEKVDGLTSAVTEMRFTLSKLRADLRIAKRVSALEITSAELKRRVKALEKRLGLSHDDTRSS